MHLFTSTVYSHTQTTHPAIHYTDCTENHTSDGFKPSRAKFHMLIQLFLSELDKLSGTHTALCCVLCAESFIHCTAGVPNQSRIFKHCPCAKQNSDVSSAP